MNDYANDDTINNTNDDADNYVDVNDDANDDACNYVGANNDANNEWWWFP